MPDTATPRTGNAPSVNTRPLAGFDDPVPDDGYRWWYIDAISDDGRHALTAIVFIGSVFSPWYRRARLRGPTPALEHSAVNLALYGPIERWCMTERPARDTTATPDRLTIGSSSLSRDGERLQLDLNERGMPVPHRLAGRLSVSVPDSMRAEPVWLDSAHRHRWQPLAPQTRIEVDLVSPALRWSGTAYVDSNRGSEPLEAGFSTWHWSRSHARDGSTRVRYDVIDRQGRESARTLDISPNGDTVPGPPGRPHALARTRWFGMSRPTRLVDGATPEGLQTQENAPFYSRSRLIESVDGERRDCVHESLDMDRFTKRSTQLLLPFRTPRLAYTRGR